MKTLQQNWRPCGSWVVRDNTSESIKGKNTICRVDTVGIVLVSIWVPRVMVWLWIAWDSVGVGMKLNHWIWNVEADDILLVMIKNLKIWCHVDTVGILLVLIWILSKLKHSNNNMPLGKSCDIVSNDRKT